MSEERPTTEIPDKLYFRMGEVSRILGVEPYVLRFWESEFPMLAPRKSDTGHRRFRRQDVETLLQIKHLLYEKRFTIEGARQLLAKRKQKQVVQGSLFPDEPLQRIREELADLLAFLK